MDSVTVPKYKTLNELMVEIQESDDLFPEDKAALLDIFENLRKRKGPDAATSDLMHSAKCMQNIQLVEA